MISKKTIIIWVSTLFFKLTRKFEKLDNAAYMNYIKHNYQIHKSVHFWKDTYIYGAGKIFIDEGTYLGRNTFITSFPSEAIIKIGKRCMISHNVHIRTSAYDEKTLSMENRGHKFDNIEIGDFVWIGVNVYIKGGVKIGNNVIIGANSLVTKSFPDNVVIGGSPAKILREIK